MKFDRALSLARYNWPLYVVCISSVIAGCAVGLATDLPLPIRVIALIGAGVAAWYAVASFWAFHAMFDRSSFLDGRWLKGCAEQPVDTCVQLGVFLEETTLPTDHVFPEAECVNVDLFDSQVMTEPAVTRARGGKQEANLRRAQPNAISVGDAASDLTIVTLAAHEIRDPAMRESLFEELVRITKPGGRIIIVEHLRTVSAFFAFGPGVLHFYPRRVWINIANKVHLRLVQEHDVAPFVHVFVFERVV